LPALLFGFLQDKQYKVVRFVVGSLNNRPMDLKQLLMKRYEDEEASDSVCL
jgi:hypothetical protein